VYLWEIGSVYYVLTMTHAIVHSYEITFSSGVKQASAVKSTVYRTEVKLSQIVIILEYKTNPESP